jgi:rhodanese-related sulfurtransferase
MLARARLVTVLDGQLTTDPSRSTTPERKPQLTTPISRDDLHRRITAGDRLVLVEALGPAYFADAHILGAVNVPPDQVDRLASALMPDKHAPIVVYCSGTCHNSEITARRLVELGYTDVHVYLGGKEDWVEHGLPVERSDDTG